MKASDYKDFTYRCHELSDDIQELLDALSFEDNSIKDLLIHDFRP